jgi:hypothetical protein
LFIMAESCVLVNSELDRSPGKPKKAQLMRRYFD